MKFDRTKMIEAPCRVRQREHDLLDIMWVCVRGYVAFPLSFRNIKERMAEGAALFNHSTPHRGTNKRLPVLAAVCCKRWRRRWISSVRRVKRDYRAAKRITRPMFEFKSVRCAWLLRHAIETMNMICKRQMGDIKDNASASANAFYLLVF